MYNMQTFAAMFDSQEDNSHTRLSLLTGMNITLFFFDIMMQTYNVATINCIRMFVYWLGITLLLVIHTIEVLTVQFNIDGN